MFSCITNIQIETLEINRESNDKVISLPLQMIFTNIVVTGDLPWPMEDG